MTTPLAGRRIVVTRRPEQSAALTSGLLALGATVVEVPLLELAPPDDSAAIARVLAELDRYHWVALTSANAARALADGLRAAGRSLAVSARVATVGPSTSAAVRELLGVEPALEPASDFRAEGLLRAFDPFDLTGQRVLVPLSDRARDVLPEGLRGRGAVVDAVVAYRTAVPADARQRLEQALVDGVDLVTLASPSAVEGLTGALGESARGLAVAVIGPVTELAARSAGLAVRVVASPSTTDGLLAALVRQFEAGQEG